MKKTKITDDPWIPRVASGVPVWDAFDEIAKRGELKAHPRNPNKHSAEQLRLYLKIILGNGWRRSVVVSRRSGFVIKGHGAVMAAELGNLQEVPIRYQDYATAEDELKDLLADNELARLAQTNEGELNELVLELQAAGIDAELAGVLKKIEQPGFVKWNEKQTGGTLYLYQSTSNKGTYGHIKIHPALAQCLKAHSAWHARHWPTSPWYFPSPENPSKPVAPESLTHALRRVAAELGLPHRTSHGLRSYSTNVLRSQRKADGTPTYTDGEVALRHGQKSGGKLIVYVYGKVNEEPLSYLPSGSTPPAWEQQDPGAIRVEQLTLGL